MSELTDLEICKKMADIEHVHYIETKYEDKNFLAIVGENDFTGTPCEIIGEYNPLTEDALCFKLMVKYDVLREATGTIYFRAVIANYGNGPEYYRATAETLNKAICLAIIEANQ